MLDKGKTRSLAEINTILSSDQTLEQIINGLLSSRNQLDVLEVGIGYGRCLLELAHQFRDRNVVFHGITLKSKAPLEKREDFLHIAEEFDIISAGDTQNFTLPQVYFYDATKLHFADESIDLLYSAVTVRFIHRKAEFIEEIARVLKPGGQAIIDISESNWDYPYSLAIDDRLLTTYTNRFVLRYGEELIPLPIYLKLFEGNNFHFCFSSKGKCILYINKLKSSKLSLNLNFNEDLSMSGFDLPLKNSEGKIRSGFRSVYDVQPEFYAALFTNNLLTPRDF